MADSPPIYVGYMSMPVGVRRAVRAALLTLVIVMVGSAALIASGQRDPGPAVWDTSTVRSWTSTSAGAACAVSLGSGSGS